MTPEKQHPGGNRGGNSERSDQESTPNQFVVHATPRQDLRTRLVANAMRYLSTLLGCTEDEAWTAPVTFQIFDDTPRKDQGRAKVLHGCLDDLGDHLEELNAQGDGIFITINQTDLKGRKKTNIAALRAAWADIDDKIASEPFDLNNLPLAPTMVVRSGHGVHLYWCFPEAIPCDETRRAEHEAMLRGIQTVLAPFGADPKVCFVQTVLRLPGYYNMKLEPVLVVVYP